VAIRNFSTSSIKTGSSRNTVWDQVSYGASFAAGNQSVTDLYTLANSMALKAPTSPSAGGTLTVNNVSLGSYDYTIRNAETVTFAESNYFTSTEDARSAFIVWNGNCTINAGTVFKPVKRKLFTVLYINGNLTLNGEISMSQRGANHSGTGNSGGSVTAGNVLIYSGTHGGVSNPQIPTAGGAGGSDAVGTTGTSGGTGGGGSGNNGEGVGPSYGYAGAAGTSFTGGTGAAGQCCNTNSGAVAPVVSGGKGGSAQTNSIADAVGGGAGNPGGERNNGGYSAGAGSDGTGGVLVIFVTGTISGTGTITAAGANGGFANGSGNAYTRPGGGSGGGSVTVLYGSDSSSITPTASGGAGGTSTGSVTGYAGGAGTARKLAI
jgi:hypothetical protein